MKEIACARYRPKPYNGNAVLFMARNQPELPGMETAPGFGWGELVAGQLGVHEIPGDRHSMLRRPNVDQVAALLRPLLNPH